MISRGDATAMVDERLRIDAEEFKTLHLMTDVWLRNMDLDVTAEMVSAYIFAKEKKAQTGSASQQMPPAFPPGSVFFPVLYAGTRKTAGI